MCWASSRDVGYTNGVEDVYAQWAISCHRQVYRIRMNYWVMDCGTFRKPDCYSGQYVGGTAHFLWDERFNASFFSKRLVVSENFPGYRWYCAESYGTIEFTKGGDVEKIPGGGEEANCKKL
ncbi:MAG TPA: hypothetical protein VG602_01365 [Actinomycetota bacterium]|nr:hypothetical protein [Actinomycetota bacterium]